MRNPLRYPGAKSKLFDYVKKLIETEELRGCTFYEPFAGSATLSWQLLEDGIIENAVINEKDPLLYHFWNSVFNYTDELIELITNTEINIETWNECAKYKELAFLLGKNSYQIGFAALFLNRTNFSGILKANPIGGKKQESDYKLDCRFNKEKIIKSILDISKYKNNVKVFNDDAIDFMRKELKYKRNRCTFVYIDPPYYKEGPGLYRYYYLDSQHRKLADFIKSKKFPWLLSYDDTLEIRKLYNRRTCINLYLDYSVKTSKKGKEILISDLEIPPMEQEKVLVG